MLLESVMLAVPLLTLSALFGPPPMGGPPLRVQLVQALGAGVYEELVFRLLLISGLAWVLAEVLHMWRKAAWWTAIGLAAVIFALCHFEPIGSDSFGWGPFWFRLAAGAYLSAVFVGRGLGIASGSHAAYNLLLVWLRSGAA
jgi:membrane protease YdiL (CAAX protease family)